MAETGGGKLAVTNRSESTVDLAIDVIAPSATELLPGYEIIPDTAWVKIVLSTFTLAAHTSAVTDIQITVPKDAKFYGKKFQVYIWSHTILPPSKNIGVGLQSRLLLEFIPLPRIKKTPPPSPAPKLAPQKPLKTRKA